MSDIYLFNSIVYGIERCPQCGVANPLINLVGKPEKHYKDSWENTYYYFTAVCSKCRRHVLFYGRGRDNPDKTVRVVEHFPSLDTVPVELPTKAGKFLQQALESRHAPDGAVMLTASAIDAMLKDKGYADGSLYSRIESAAKAGLLTSEMGGWAHEIRLGANEPRHADEEFAGASTEDADQIFAFAKALGEYLYVLPARVKRWKEKAEGSDGTVTEA